MIVPMKTTFIIIRLLAALLTAGLLAGCVPFGIGMGVVVPVPPLSKKKIEQGHEITAQEVAFVVPGRMTRAEVITRLGNDFRDSPRVAALAYSWQYNGPQIYWGYGFIFVGVIEHGVEDFGWRALFVAFDQNDRVVQSRFYRLKGGKSLDEQLEEWAQRHGAASPSANPCVQFKMKTNAFKICWLHSVGLASGFGRVAPFAADRLRCRLSSAVIGKTYGTVITRATGEVHNARSDYACGGGREILGDQFRDSPRMPVLMLETATVAGRAGKTGRQNGRVFTSAGKE